MLLHVTPGALAVLVRISAGTAAWQQSMQACFQRSTVSRGLRQGNRSRRQADMLVATLALVVPCTKSNVEAAWREACAVWSSRKNYMRVQQFWRADCIPRSSCQLVPRPRIVHANCRLCLCTAVPKAPCSNYVHYRVASCAAES
jgi:hypothetical protein